ncbi:PREDICTED: epigen-like [Poecilia mexicana]|uniref:EGF-like domain-containing protein n=1 Tax=Poecilia mexicana TaxID=48701 RepID=A0A3B3XEI4_9TELE|nr:PREDICTED: epigen-like [Poecilia mexicana]
MSRKNISLTEDNMSTQRQTFLRKVPTFTVTVLLLLATTGKSEVLSDATLTTVSPSFLNSSLTAQTVNSTTDHSKVQHSVRPCGAENQKYCLNDGKCIYPQDSLKPSCICMPSHSGPRCEIFIVTGLTYQPLTMDKIIPIFFGCVMISIILGLVVCCFIKRRCIKSAPLIKAAASETSV